MIDRRLVLHHEGAPVAWALFAADIRQRILVFPDDHAGLLRVWTVPSHRALSAGEDITERFALEWSKEFDFSDGIEPSEYLARFPAFVREYAGDSLTKDWVAAIGSAA